MSLKTKWFLAILLIALIAGGGIYAYKRTQQPVPEAKSEPTLQTAKARRGELVVSATGAGAVIPVSERDLSFAQGGLLTDVAVQVGDTVQEGQPLAHLDDTDARAQVLSAEIALKEAKLKMEQLTEAPSSAALASAQASLAAAQADLTRLTTPATAADLTAARQNLLSAQATLKDLLDGPSPEEIASVRAELELAQAKLQQAQADYDKIAWRPDIGSTPQAAALQEATSAYQKAQANYDLAASGATDEQIAAARAKVAQAQAQLNTLVDGPDDEAIAAAEAKVAQAQAQLDDLMAGADAIETELAQLAVDKANNTLAAAQKKLEETELTANVDGIVADVRAAAGEYVSVAPIITIIEKSQPMLEVLVDETDLDKVAVGYEAEVIFDAFPDDTFTGHVTRVDPVLSNTGGVSAVRVEVKLDDYAKTIPLPIGLNASVEIIGGRATNAVLVPVEALRELEPGKYAVFVVDAGGSPQLRLVEVGLQDFTTAEITSGLEAGEIVTTGVVKTAESGK